MTCERCLPLVVAAAFIAACHPPVVVKSVCVVDSDCTAGLILRQQQLHQRVDEGVRVVTDGNPILQPSPYTVSFGDLDTATQTLPVELHNIGNCTLTLFEADLTGGVDGGATGPFCATSAAASSRSRSSPAASTPCRSATTPTPSASPATS